MKEKFICHVREKINKGFSDSNSSSVQDRPQIKKLKKTHTHILICIHPPKDRFSSAAEKYAHVIFKTITPNFWQILIYILSKRNMFVYP